MSELQAIVDDPRVHAVWLYAALGAAGMFLLLLLGLNKKGGLVLRAGCAVQTGLPPAFK